MSIQSSCSKIPFAFKHHFSKGLSLIFGQGSDSGKGILHRVDLLWFLLLLAFSVFFSWAIGCPVSCLPAFEAFPLLHQCLSFFECRRINIHRVGVFLLGWSVPASVRHSFIVLLDRPKNSCRFSVVCVKLDCFFKPVFNCLGNYLTIHDFVGEGEVKGFSEQPDEVDIVRCGSCHQPSLSNKLFELRHHLFRCFLPLFQVLQFAQCILDSVHRLECFVHFS